MALNDIQRKLAEHIASGDDISIAAQKANCHRNSFYNWRELPEFKAYLEELSDAAKEQSKKLLSFGSPKAAQKLLTIIESKGNGTAVVNACKVVLTVSGVLVEKQEPEAAEPEHLDPADIKAQLELRRSLKVVTTEDTEQSKETG